MQIPWTPDLRYIPWIIRAHHEKLNGEGYPLGLREPDIPLQSRIMMICDIFDALCAADRPYKKAIPVADALVILQKSANRNEIDEELLRIFIADRIYERGTARDDVNSASALDEPVGLSSET
jgi:HD-GYP domain-containing protein (c-di-GMP phosphodiesterase class II)